MSIEHVPRTIAWVDAEEAASSASVRMIDQRLLPDELVIREIGTYEEMIDAISTLAVRGAPAIGVAGAMGLGLWLVNQEGADASVPGFQAELERVANDVATARPTAVNLSYEVDRFQSAIRSRIEESGAASITPEFVSAYVRSLADADERTNRSIGEHGAALLPEDACVITHCNAGSLATVFYGTPLGVIYAAHERGLIAHVFSDETRPVDQGKRLTMWELTRAGVPATLQCDSMAADLMSREHIDAVIVGADRIAANGDTANKIGTFQLAIAAAYHGVPFYVAAPWSTIDTSVLTGADIPIEFRHGREVLDPHDFEVAVRNPAFDVTPAPLITAIITENGVIHRSDGTPDAPFDLTAPTYR